MSVDRTRLKDAQVNVGPNGEPAGPSGANSGSGSDNNEQNSDTTGTVSTGATVGSDEAVEQLRHGMIIFSYNYIVIKVVI